MRVNCTMLGAVVPRHPKQGLTDLVNAGFTDLMLDFNIFGRLNMVIEDREFIDRGDVGIDAGNVCYEFCISRTVGEEILDLAAKEGIELPDEVMENVAGGGDIIEGTATAIAVVAAYFAAGC